MLTFYKLHGLGNDFIVVDETVGGPAAADLLQADVARRLCHRHTGIGADGLIVLLPPEDSDYDSRMVILNADGSRPEMCGNGIRCAAKVLHDHRQKRPMHNPLRIETDAGLKTCHLSLAADGRVSQVRVEMGRPHLARQSLPMVSGEGPLIDQPFVVGEHTLQATAVSMGNPHLVIFVGDDISPETGARTLGPTIERHQAFPQRTNVEFARCHDDHIELWVWERGCGITSACGTGACATAVAAVVTHRAPAQTPLTVRLPGGNLTIEVEDDLSAVLMTGPAVDVFQGTYGA